VARGQASSVGVDGVHDVVAGSLVEQVVLRLGPGQGRSGGVEPEVVEDAPGHRLAGDEGDELHSPAASRAGEHVEGEHLRSSSAQGTLSTLAALKHVLRRWGRFCELYTDRGAHFCRTGEAGQGPDDEQHGQVARVLRALGIRHILARSPDSRGRSERAFGTIQGRFPQELRLAGIRSYDHANRYLTAVFVPDFNRRFTVTPFEPESAFTPLAAVDLELLLTAQHERVVRNDSTVVFGKLELQLPRTKDRIDFARCPVIVHELLDGTLAVSFQAKLIARFDRTGALLPKQANPGKAA